MSLGLLREVVGQGHSEEALREAWAKSRGDVAAAANLLLDAPRVQFQSLAGGQAVVDLDEEPVEPKRTDTSFLKMLQVKQESQERPKKRPRKEEKLEPKVQEVQEWSFPLGLLEVVAYSTMRLEGGAMFPGADGAMGPLLQSGSPLELRWRVDAKRRGKECGQVSFEAHGQAVGKFPSWTSGALAPLLSRKLIHAEAFVGKDPPRALDLGTNIPISVQISLSSSALRNPGDMADVGVGKRQGQNAKLVQKAEAERETQRNAISILLEKLQLPCPRRAVLDEPVEDTMGGKQSANAGASGEGEDDEEEEAEEISRSAAVQLGRRDHLERSHLPGIVLPEKVFETQLRPYQEQAVYWMWQRENPTSSLPAVFKRSDRAVLKSSAPCRQLHPMWDEYELPQPVQEKTKLYFHRPSGALSLDFPDAALAYCRGGILADDMGLGKTVMCLALMALDQVDELPSARTAAPELKALEASSADVAGVLVVAPLSLIRQWQDEVRKHMGSACPSMHEFHGTGSRSMSLQQLCHCGIVFTTYNTLAAQSEDSLLFQVYWRRIILDEAHAIKNRCSKQAQAAFRLQGFCRWSVTGTPLQNSVEELFSAVRFLRVEPWCNWSSWRQSVSVPLDKGRQGDSKAMTEALDQARRIVTPLILRRTKATLDCEGKPLLVLPKKHVHVMHLQLSAAERDFYETLWSKAKTQFDTFVEKGEVLAKYTHILQLILKLRQALCHPFMVFARSGTKDEDLQNLEKRYLLGTCGDGVNETFTNNLLEEIRSGQLSDCAVCMDLPQDPTLTPCGHIFCRECCYDFIQRSKGECPICRTPNISKKSLKVLPGASRFPAQLMAKASSNSTSHHSTKMKQLMSLLRVDIAEGHRVVVYSQFTSFMDLISSALDSEKIEHKRFDGSLNLDQRAECVAWLAEETIGRSGARVLLVSLKAGGTGLNLVAASRLYLMDLWWNPAVEEQAIQRVHRIGQKQEVHIYKFVVEATR